MECSVLVSIECGRKCYTDVGSFVKQCCQFACNRDKGNAFSNVRDCLTQTVGRKWYHYHQSALKLSIREVIIVVTIAACISSWCCFLPRAKMVRPVRVHTTPRLQQSKIEPERDPQHGKQPDSAEGKIIADYNQDVDYEWWKSEVELDAREQREDYPDAAYAKMEIYSEIGTSARGYCLGKCTWKSCRYMRHEDLKSWSCGFRICMSGLNSAPKRPNCSSESKD